MEKLLSDKTGESSSFLRKDNYAENVESQFGQVDFGKIS